MNYSYYTNLRPEIYAWVPREAFRILEIGCAAGEFRSNFQTDVEYWGVEPNLLAAEDSKKKGIKVLCGAYDAVCDQIPNGYFDVVVCNDVIEHVFDSEGFLKSIRTKVRDMARIGHGKTLWMETRFLGASAVERGF